MVSSPVQRFPSPVIVNLPSIAATSSSLVAGSNIMRISVFPPLASISRSYPRPSMNDFVFFSPVAADAALPDVSAKYFAAAERSGLRVTLSVSFTNTSRTDSGDSSLTFDCAGGKISVEFPTLSEPFRREFSISPVN